MIYTDGSGINEKVGAVAVSPNIGPSFRSYLEPDTSFTVYAAELHGTLQALTVVWVHRMNIPTRKAIINTDNQASIRALGDPGKKSGQALVIQAIRSINEIRSQRITVELHWIPAHIEIQGSEWADQEAKAATG